jgi:hypothetical protein
LVATEGQLLQLVRYIHQMPIKEELARKPADYPHSSHHHYAKPGSSWLSTKRVRDLLRRRGVRDKEAYEQWTTRPVGGRQARQFETARVSLPAPHARLPLTDTVGAPAEALMALEAGDWPSAARARARRGRRWRERW